MDELDVEASVELETIGEVVESSFDFRFAFGVVQCFDIERIPVGLVMEEGRCIQGDQGYELTMIFV